MDIPPAILFAAGGLLVLAALVGGPWLAHRRRQRLGTRPFPAAWRKQLQREFPLYNHLPHPLQKRLQAMVQVFVAEKPIIGCQGLDVTEPMRVLIAAQACVPVLALHAHADAGLTGGLHPYPDLREVLLYPGAFVVEAKRQAPGGVVTTSREVRLGESWQEGRVVLSWQDVVEGARSGQWPDPARQFTPAPPAPSPARNVVMHEFAHQLDQENGPANGAPPLRKGQSAQTWAQVFHRAYADLNWLHEAGEATILDPYGTTAPEEFFAVATEAFFMNPGALQAQHPPLYRQLQQYFGLDPAQWSGA